MTTGRLTLLIMLAAGPSGCCTGGMFAPPPGLTHNVGTSTQLRPAGAPAPAAANAVPSTGSHTTGSHTVFITPVVTQRMGKKPVLVHRLIRPPHIMGAIEAHEVVGANGEKTLLLGPPPGGKDEANPAAPTAAATPIEAVVVP